MPTTPDRMDSQCRSLLSSTTRILRGSAKTSLQADYDLWSTCIADRLLYAAKYSISCLLSMLAETPFPGHFKASMTNGSKHSIWQNTRNTWNLIQVALIKSTCIYPSHDWNLLSSATRILQGSAVRSDQAKHFDISNCCRWIQFYRRVSRALHRSSLEWTI